VSDSPPTGGRVRPGAGDSDMEPASAGTALPQEIAGEANGGFPEPLAGEGVRTVATTHGSCGKETQIRLPSTVPAGLVRRAVCAGCGEQFATEDVEEVSVTPRGASALPHRSPWFVALASVVLAAVAVIVALLLLQSGSEVPDSASGDRGGGNAAGGPGGQAGQGSGTGGGSSRAGDSDAPANARLVRKPNFSLAIPPGWKRSNPPAGATFAAEEAGGGADAALWVERDSELGFAEFQARSLERLKRIAPNARVDSRVPAPTDTGTVVTLVADAPSGDGGQTEYQVTLSAAGPFRYYLVTSSELGGSRLAQRGVQLVHGSFIPATPGAKKEGE